MNRKALLAFGVAAVLGVAAAFFLFGNLDGIVKKAVEAVAPKMTQTTVTLASVHLSPSSGAGEVQGLVIGNPEGYKSEFAIRVGHAALALDPKSVLSDKIHITQVLVTEPEINIEGGLGDNNLKRILANVQRFAGDEKSAKSSAPGGSGKKLQVDEFTLTGARVAVRFGILGGRGLTLPVPDIHLTNLGSGSDGITPGDLMEKVFGALLDSTTSAVGKGIAGAVGAVGGAAKGGLDKAAAGIGNLFKK